MQIESLDCARAKLDSTENAGSLTARKEHRQIGSWREALLAEFSQRVSDQRVAPGVACVHGGVRDHADDGARERMARGVGRNALKGGRSLGDGASRLQLERRQEKNSKEKSTGPKA